MKVVRKKADVDKNSIDMKARRKEFRQAMPWLFYDNDESLDIHGDVITGSVFDRNDFEWSCGIELKKDGTIVAEHERYGKIVVPKDKTIDDAYKMISRKFKMGA